jgi:ATP-binding protein involved in chromosome partitioning
MTRRYKDIVGDGGSNIAGQVRAQQARLHERLRGVKAVVAIVSGKGGVGKSSLTANLANCLALDAWRVGVLDADLNGPTMAKMLGVRGRTLAVGAGGVTPPESALGVKVMSMDLLLSSDDTPLAWQAPRVPRRHRVG